MSTRAGYLAPDDSMIIACYLGPDDGPSLDAVVGARDIQRRISILKTTRMSRGSSEPQMAYHKTQLPRSGMELEVQVKFQNMIVFRPSPTPSCSGMMAQTRGHSLDMFLDQKAAKHNKCAMYVLHSALVHRPRVPTHGVVRCCDVYRNATSIDCAGRHTFCRSCITLAFKRSRKCPLCQTDASVLTANLEADRWVGRLRIRCPLEAKKQPNATAWVGALSDLKQHYARDCHLLHVDCARCALEKRRYKMRAANLKTSHQRLKRQLDRSKAENARLKVTLCSLPFDASAQWSDLKLSRSASRWSRTRTGTGGIKGCLLCLRCGMTRCRARCGGIRRVRVRV